MARCPPPPQFLHGPKPDGAVQTRGARFTGRGVRWLLPAVHRRVGRGRRADKPGIYASRAAFALEAVGTNDVLASRAQIRFGTNDREEAGGVRGCSAVNRRAAVIAMISCDSP